MLNISSVETADSGVYSCTASAIDTSGSQYILSSVIHNDTVDVTVSKLVVLTTRCIYILFVDRAKRQCECSVHTSSRGEETGT